MAKENNLKDLLTDVADAIREKKGTTDLINPQGFGEEIRSIEAGNRLGVTMIDDTGGGLSNVVEITISEGVVSVLKDCAIQSSKVERVNLPSTLQRIEQIAFNTVTTLTYIGPFPSVFNYIGAQAFQYCISLKYLDFSNVRQVPTLASTNAFTSTKCQFVVPDALYDDWIVATNWTTYADRIVKASDFGEPTNE